MYTRLKDLRESLTNPVDALLASAPGNSPHGSLQFDSYVAAISMLDPELENLLAYRDSLNDNIMSNNNFPLVMRLNEYLGHQAHVASQSGMPADFVNKLKAHK